MIEYERIEYTVYKLGREEFDGDDSDRGTGTFATASQHA